MRSELNSSMDIPQYCIRESRRARRVSLRVLPPDGMVEVVIPQGGDHAIAPLAVENHRDWIMKQQEKIVARQTVMQTKPQYSLPIEICLAAVERNVVVQYHPVEGTRAIRFCPVDDNHLDIIGKISDISLVQRALRAYLQEEGKAILPAWLWRLADRHGKHTGLQPTRVGVRLQQTRWGSCSAKGNISLNAKLLLLPPKSVDHVMLHELAHLRVHNHSVRYWDFLSRIDPDWQQGKTVLRQHESEMPWWVGRLVTNCQNQ